MKEIAILLSGCGYKDGAEITESVSSLICLSEKNISLKAFSLDKDISVVSEKTKETYKKNLLEESERIYRKEVKNIKSCNPDEFEGLVIPGGFGVATHFCDWAQKGSACSVDPDIKRVIETFHKQSKPILALCIAPSLISRILGHTEVNLTIGNDPGTAKEIEKTGAKHINCEVTDFITDRENKVISSPCYMYGDATSYEVFTGVKKAVSEFYEMA